MQTKHQASIIRLAALSLAAMVFVGCTATTPTIDTSPEAELSFDGLYPVEGGRMDAAWARADFSVEPYSKIMLEGIGIQYRPDGESRRNSLRSTAQGGHFEITPEQKERFRNEMREAFLEEMAKGEHFEIVDEAAPDVLLIRVGLLDVASFVPPEPIGMSDIYLSRVGEATLVLEIVDSVSDAILVRALDRRAAEDASGMGFTESNRVTNRAEVRRLARYWGKALSEGLDRFMAPGDAAGE